MARKHQVVALAIPMRFMRIRDGDVLDHPDRMLEIRQQARRTIIERFDLATACLPRQIELIETLSH
jgi:hypothetical protein